MSPRRDWIGRVVSIDGQVPLPWRLWNDKKEHFALEELERTSSAVRTSELPRKEKNESTMKESLNLESRRQPKAGPLYRTLTTRQGTRVTVPRRSRRDQQAFEQANRPYREGRWSKEERLLFLQGLKTFGVGKWKEIGTLVTTR